MGTVDPIAEAGKEFGISLEMLIAGSQAYAEADREEMPLEALCCAIYIAMRAVEELQRLQPRVTTIH